MAIEWNSNKTAAALAIAGSLIYGVGQKACDDCNGEHQNTSNVGMHETAPMPQQKTTGDLVRALLQRLNVK
ncbi:MAG: hypothetical protein WCT53_06315 [Candidatus Gracilibacteria bacterium]|jgi:hypothetical protein